MEPPAGLAVAVLVRIDHGTYAVPAGAVGEVLPVPALTRVPVVPPWLSGVANWRGRVLAVLDLRPLLGLAAAERAAPAVLLARTRSRVVVVSSAEASVGLLVDEVIGVVDDELPTPEPLPTTLPAAAARILASQVIVNGEPVGVLDVAAVLDLRLQLDRTRAG